MRDSAVKIPCYICNRGYECHELLALPSLEHALSGKRTTVLGTLNSGDEEDEEGEENEENEPF
jgi:hypothetical protein